jgi:hypothetical protein
MTKNGPKKRAWAVGAAFFVFSGAVALGWPYEADLWALRMLQDHRSGFLDAVLSLFPLLGGLEVSGVILLVLLIGLFLRDRQALAGRILAVFVATGLLELAMKLFLPQVPVQKETTRAGRRAARRARAPLSLSERTRAPQRHHLRGVVPPFGELVLARRLSAGDDGYRREQGLFRGALGVGRRGRGVVGSRRAFVGVREKSWSASQLVSISARGRTKNVCVKASFPGF